MKTGLIFRSIRFRIALAYSLVFLSIIAITSYLIFRNLKTDLSRVHFLNLSQEANNILDRVTLDPLQIPLTTREQSILIWVDSELGSTVLYEKPGFPTEYLILFQDYQPESERDYSAMNQLSLDSLDVQLVQRDIPGLQAQQLKLLLAKNNDEFYKQLRSIRSQMIWANSLAVILSTIIAIALSKFSIRPVLDVINKARQIKASENMDRLPPARSNDEIGQLSDTINDMIQRIEESIKNQNRFFAMAAHELRTPLANMQSELEYRMSATDEQLTPETIGSLREEVIRLKNIVQDFLLMSQLKSDTLALRKSAFRLDDLLYDTLERMRPVMKRSDFEIKLSLEANADQLSVEADREKIEAVLINLFDNARKYGDNQKPIIITFQETAGQIELSISNSTRENPEAVQKGMGLGLQIAERIMHKHGFSYTVSKSKANFTISLGFPQDS